MTKAVSKSITEQLFENYPSVRPFITDLINGKDPLERMIAEREAGQDEGQENLEDERNLSANFESNKRQKKNKDDEATLTYGNNKGDEKNKKQKSSARGNLPDEETLLRLNKTITGLLDDNRKLQERISTI